MSEFANRLRTYLAWQQKSIPLGSPVAMAFVNWLLQHRNKPTPVSHFYLEAAASEPTAREVVREFKRVGLVAFRPSEVDLRVKLICPTERFDQLVDEWQKQLARLAA